MFPCLHTFDEPHSEYLNSLSLSPDGILLVGCFHNLVKVWDLTTGNINHSFELHGDRYGHFNTLVNPDWKSIISNDSYRIDAENPRRCDFPRPLQVTSVLVAGG